MSIAFGAIGTKATQSTGATPIAIGYPATPGAGDMGVAARASWNTIGAVPSTEPGWTQAGELFGGNAGGAVDNHKTHAAADYQQLTGSESGSVNFDIAGTVDGAAGVMLRYTKGAGETWDTVTATTGDDATHAANRSITGSGTLALAPGDMVVVVVSTGTDAALTVTSPAITAAGITFGATTRRTSGAGSTAGQDGNVEVFDAVVASGSGTVAPTLAFTTATSQSGPAVFIRLRAIASTVTVDVDAAILSLSGVTPSVAGSGSAGVALDVASLALAGVTTTASGSGTAAATVDTAALSLAGVTPAAVGASAAIAVDPAALALTGLTPGAAGSGTGGTTVDPASLPLTGVTPALAGSGSSSVDLDVASLGLSGGTPAFGGSGEASVSVDFATLILTGVDPSVVGSGSAVAAVDPAVLTLTGVDVEFSAGGIIVDIDPATLHLSGITPTLTGDGSAQVTLDVATLTLVGLTPGAGGSGSAPVLADTAFLTLTGVDPLLGGAGEAIHLVDTALLVLTGVDVGATVTPEPSDVVIVAVVENDRVVVFEENNRGVAVMETKVLLVLESQRTVTIKEEQ